MGQYEIIKIRTLYKYPFFGALVSGVPIVETTDPRIKRAATDGKSVFMRREFMESIPPKQQVFVLAHEYLHIAFGHLTRMKGKDKRLWNQATDAVINEMLVADNLEAWPDCIRREGAQLLTADEIYEELLKEKREQKQKQQQQKNDAGQGAGNGSNDEMDDESDGQDHDGEGQEDDSHFMWEDAVKNHDDAVKQQIYQTSVQRAIAAGNSTSSVARAFKIYKDKKPLIPWNYLLRQTVAKNYDWSYRHAELEDYVLTAKLESLPHAESEILIDTSGSIDEKLINAFLTEVFGMLRNTDVKVGCFDTKFYGFEKFNRRDLGKFKPVGGGGTNFDAAVNAFTNRAINKIIFTDGYAPMPQNSVRAIWVVIGQTKIEPKGGKVIYISEEELRKMALESNSPVKEQR